MASLLALATCQDPPLTEQQQECIAGLTLERAADITDKCGSTVPSVSLNIYIFSFPCTAMHITLILCREMHATMIVNGLLVKSSRTVTEMT